MYLGGGARWKHSGHSLFPVRLAPGRLRYEVVTGDVRYVMFEYYPSVFKTGMAYAVPLKSLTLAADGKSLGYQGVNREQLDGVATDKKDWKQALASARYLVSVDTAYGVKREKANPNLQRSSDLIGRDVSSRART